MRNFWLAAVAGWAVVAALPARADDFCLALQRVLAEAPRGFQVLEGSAIRSMTREDRQATIVLPGASFCFVSARHQYACMWRPPYIGNTPDAVHASYHRMAAQVHSCFPPAIVHANEWRADFALPEGEITTLVDIRPQDPRIELSVSSWKPIPAGWFHHQKKFDASGFYLPVRPVMAGTWQLKDISIGTLREFEDFEAGRRPPADYGPFLLEFEDLSSAEQVNELGAKYHVGQARVVPDAYEVWSSGIRFHAVDKRFGPVLFEGRIDPAALTRAKNAPPGTQASVVMVGRLSIGSTVLDGLTFTWFAGD